MKFVFDYQLAGEQCQATIYADKRNAAISMLKRTSPEAINIRTNQPEKSTCQVCGRPIKSNTGVIAHHGYKRPGYGWQTSSCPGALYLPYEVSCDRLREVIGQVKNFVARQESILTEFVANPPQTLTVTERRHSRDEGKLVTYEKPAELSKYRACMPGTYECAHAYRVYEIERELKAAKSDLAQMTTRLEQWQPQQAA